MVTGVATPHWPTIVRFHPQFALAILEGIEARPSERVLAPPQFGSLAVGQQQTASFAAQISRYAVFLDADYTIDPTGGFVGSLFQTTSDAALNARRSPTGITVKLVVRGGGEDYAPIISPTPLQLAFDKLNASAGMWKMEPNQNVEAVFYVQSPPGGVSPPFSVWAVLTFLQLGEGAQRFLGMLRRDAIDCLKAMNEWPSCEDSCPPVWPGGRWPGGRGPSTQGPPGGPPPMGPPTGGPPPATR
jgi:hypothetical protein